MKQQNFVIKNMIKLNIGNTTFHKDKKKLSKQIRKQKYKKSFDGSF
jgi:hypothetical protein